MSKASELVKEINGIGGESDNKENNEENNNNGAQNDRLKENLEGLKESVGQSGQLAEKKGNVEIEFDDFTVNLKADGTWDVD